MRIQQPLTHPHRQQNVEQEKCYILPQECCSISSSASHTPDAWVSNYQDQLIKEDFPQPIEEETETNVDKQPLVEPLTESLTEHLKKQLNEAPIENLADKIVEDDLLASDANA